MRLCGHLWMSFTVYILYLCTPLFVPENQLVHVSFVYVRAHKVIFPPCVGKYVHVFTLVYTSLRMCLDMMHVRMCIHGCTIPRVCNCARVYVCVLVCARVLPPVLIPPQHATAATGRSCRRSPPLTGRSAGAPAGPLPALLPPLPWSCSAPIASSCPADSCPPGSPCSRPPGRR